jgi:hypothetical protein
VALDCTSWEIRRYSARVNLDELDVGSIDDGDFFF